MDTIPPDIARKLLNRDFANLAQRVQRGGKLNRSERSMLQSMAASTGHAPTVAENYVELAKILGVTRRALQNWRKRKDAPKPAANGLHEVAAWREFMQRHGLEGDPAAIRGLRQSGQLTLANALELISQVCGALQYAHSKGIIHRDIKPANILVTRDGRAKVADFGLARAVGTPSRAREEPNLTVTGTIMGTPDYMAPEQREGQRVDHRADIYSLGVMLYEFLTGSLPRGAWSPPSQKVEIDVRLDEIVLHALQENPTARYQAAAEVKLDVDSVNATTGGQPLPPGVDPQPLPSSRAGGPVARPRQSSGAQKQQSVAPEAPEPSADAIMETTSSLNNTMLILGLVAIAVIGGLAFFLANRKTGDVYNSEQTITTSTTSNTYFTQLISTGVTSEKDLQAIAEVRPFGDTFVAITREEVTWSQAEELARRTGAKIISIESNGSYSREQVIEWVGTSFAAFTSAPVWVREQDSARILSGRDAAPTASLDSPRKAILQWVPLEPKDVSAPPPAPPLPPITPTPEAKRD